MSEFQTLRLQKYSTNPLWERDMAIYNARQGGATFVSIAKQHNLSPTRIRAIYYPLARLLRIEAAAQEAAPDADVGVDDQPPPQ